MFHALLRGLARLLPVALLASCASDAPSPAPVHTLPAPLAAAPAPSTEALPSPASRLDTPPEDQRGDMRADAPVPETVPEPTDGGEVTGKSLYARHCAGCHNENGDGRGKTMLDQGKEARSFAQGGFAFGNTPEAIFETITSGIPGSSLMQPFEAVMDDDERRLVAEYVISLTPYPAAVRSTDSVLTVEDRAVFARGKLPALREGLPERPRGLLVGLPGGTSFEYRVDDGRLLAVRRGAFADRTDWNERGGGVLRPLGALVLTSEGGDPEPWLVAQAGSRRVPVELALAATRVEDGGRARIEWTPKPESAHGVVRVREELYAPNCSVPECYGRRIEVERAAEAPLVTLWLGRWPEDCIQRDPRLAETGEMVSPWFVLKRDGGFDCLYVPLPCDGYSFEGPRAGKLRLGPTYLGDGGTGPKPPNPIVFDLVLVRVKAWDEALLARLEEEFAR